VILTTWQVELATGLIIVPLQRNEALAQGSAYPADCAVRSRGFGYSNEQIIRLCTSDASNE
jgi:hypothetical protein